MSDIFVSYAKEDRARIIPIVRALEKTGWSVFWDRTIPIGKTWQQVIGEEAENCRCMIVIWSTSSIQKEWVHEEADEGKRRNILFPILIDDILPPLGFRSFQAANLVGWDGIKESAAFSELLKYMSEILGDIPSKAATEENILATERTLKPVEAETKRGREVEEQEKETPENAPISIEQEKKPVEKQAKREIATEEREVAVAKRVKAEEPRHPTKTSTGERGASQVHTENITPVYLLTAAAMVSSYFFVVELDYVSVSFYMIALFLVAYIGHRYGSKIGLVSGLIAFLPSLVLHLLGPSIGEFTARGALGAIRTPDGDYRRTLGLGYVFFGSVGFITGQIRELMSEWSHRHDFIQMEKPPSTRIFGLLAVSYFTAFQLNIGALRLDPEGLYFLIPMYIALHYGLEVTYRYLLFMLPLFVLQVDLGSGFIDHLGLSLTYQEEIFFLLCTSALCYLRSETSTVDKINYGAFIPLMFIAVIFLFDFSQSKSLRYHAEDIALPIVLLAGSILGPRGGFRFGMIWAVFRLIDLRFGVFQWGANEMHTLVAPLFGYLGGSLLTRENFLKYGATLFMAFQGYIIVATLFTTSTTASRPDFYTGWIVGVAAGLIALVVCSAIRNFVAGAEQEQKQPDRA